MAYQWLFMVTFGYVMHQMSVTLQPPARQTHTNTLFFLLIFDWKGKSIPVRHLTTEFWGDDCDVNT